ncbi:thiol-disulfide oxidoreductase DCC family protein [Paenibacillus sp. SC116]|uniref:thiol-disulfide oxidoreductase DCC family protein n=1 Tax=Paenibacillus sp. SC116 TaxID=2968986 RepID=UPI00215B2249|nr:thiol-disulfide oxidoreductase DCC family protein [Paenibacillus sp. SC116]MCR8844119.1 thiol-disulfide oxidoreductase DCC family protein [Paenibacillus sp. SC116]
MDTVDKLNNVILFDGECNFCDHSVQFIIKRDAQALYKFASIQSDIGQQLMKIYNVPDRIDSVILIRNEKYYVKSSAALRICTGLNGGWKLLYYLIIVPRILRDMVYDILARNRYKWFGKKDSCMLPSPDIRKRFLG